MQNTECRKQNDEREHFEKIYRESRPDEIPWNSEQPPELLVELVESGKVRPGRALDLGCGLGNYAIWLAGRGFDVMGLDVSPTAIKKARQNARKKKLTAEHAENAEKKIIKNNLCGLCGLRGESGKCRFLVADLTGDWFASPFKGGRNLAAGKAGGGPDLGKPFDFVYDWGLLHHIPPQQRPRYVENVHRVLKPKGKYASLCFNEKDTVFEGPASPNGYAAAGTGKIRNTYLGTVVYLSSENELRELFSRYFEIIDFRVLEIAAPAALLRKAKQRGMTHVFNYCFMQKKGRFTTQNNT